MKDTVSWREWRWVLVAALVVVVVTGLPYLYAWLTTPPGRVYTGLIVNPLDGNSYLAKMRQGATGNWLFKLPFTTEPQRGAFVFTYYLLIGHLCALLGVPLIAGYHIARSLNGILLLLIAYRFIAEFLTDVAQRRIAFMVVALSSGLGWLLATSGIVGPDLWVPESNTFFTLFVNPHFPLAEALMLLTFLGVAGPLKPRTKSAERQLSARREVGRYVLAAGASVALAVVQPFAVLTVYVVLGAYLLWVTWSQRNWPLGTWARAVVTGLATAPVVVYDYVVYTQDPTLAAWSAQNLTLTPPVGQTVLGYGLLVPLAIAGAVWCLRRREGLLLVFWVVLTSILLYAPFALQRRLIIGLHLPVAVLASIGLVKYVLPWVGRRRFVVTAAVLLVLLPSNLFLMVVSVAGSARGEWPLYTTAGEKAAMVWLRDSTSSADTVLASPRTGLLIPAWAGNRVVYGHPFETIAASAKKAAVEEFFAGQSGPADVLQRYDIRYVFMGPAEKALGTLHLESSPPFTVVYSNPDVTLYRVAPQSESKP